MPPAPRPSGPKTKPPLTNPTSTKATVYTYTCIALILLYQYLDDNPRHLRYRETQRKEAGSKRDHHHDGKSPCPRPRTSRSPSPPPLPPRPRKSERHPRPRHETLGCRREYVPDQPARGQKREAWTRMRSVTPIKRVRWGPVHIREFEREVEKGHGDSGDDKAGKRDEGRTEQKDKKTEKPERTQKDVPSQKREIWGSVTDDDIWRYGFWGPWAPWCPGDEE